MVNVLGLLVGWSLIRLAGTGLVGAEAGAAVGRGAGWLVGWVRLVGGLFPQARPGSQDTLGARQPLRLGAWPALRALLSALLEQDTLWVREHTWVLRLNSQQGEWGTPSPGQLSFEGERVAERPAHGAQASALPSFPRSSTRSPTTIIHHRGQGSEEGASREAAGRASTRGHPPRRAKRHYAGMPQGKGLPGPQERRGRGGIRCLEPKWQRSSFTSVKGRGHRATNEAIGLRSMSQR